MIFSSLITGFLTGFLSVFFILSINKLVTYFTELASNARWILIILLASGALLVGFITKYMANETKGYGVPGVISAVSLNRGIIRPILVLAKSIGSIITIGTGGSVGREDSIAQIGGGVGSTFAQIVKVNETRRITLLASGATAGIAARFNAPIVAVIFTTEVILRRSGIKQCACCGTCVKRDNKSCFSWEYAGFSYLVFYPHLLELLL